MSTLVLTTFTNFLIPTVRKRNRDGVDVPPAKVPRIEGKHLFNTIHIYM